MNVLMFLRNPVIKLYPAAGGNYVTVHIVWIALCAGGRIDFRKKERYGMSTTVFLETVYYNRTVL